jgi:hypothetical protein
MSVPLPEHLLDSTVSYCRDRHGTIHQYDAAGEAKRAANVQRREDRHIRRVLELSPEGVCGTPDCGTWAVLVDRLGLRGARLLLDLDHVDDDGAEDRRHHQGRRLQTLCPVCHKEKSRTYWRPEYVSPQGRT